MTATDEPHAQGGARVSSQSPRQAAIVGVGMSPFQTSREDTDYEGLLQEAAAEALEDAQLEMRDIDAVVLAQAPDALHGIGHPEQTAAGALALGGKPLLRVHTGGATGASAAQVGWWAAMSGRFETVLVVGAEKMGDNVKGAQQVLNQIWDPALEGDLPLNTLAMTSLVAVRYMDHWKATEEDFAQIAARLRHNGVSNPNAHLQEELSTEEVLDTPVLTWPVRLGMSCPRSSGGCALVYATQERADRLDTPAAWVGGISARANTYFMGDRMGDAGDNDFTNFLELRLAADEAYRMAGLTDPASEVDVLEPYVPFSPMEPPFLEALRMCEPGEALEHARSGRWDMDGRQPVCPSGGVVCSNPIAVTALVRVAEAALQVRGRAGDHQVDSADLAVATGVGGDYQFFVVAALGSDRWRSQQ